jgi:hypothetical protein
MIMTSHAVHVEDPSVNYHPVLEENGTMKEEIGLMSGEWDTQTKAILASLVTDVPLGCGVFLTPRQIDLRMWDGRNEQIYTKDIINYVVDLEATFLFFGRKHCNDLNTLLFPPNI